MNNNIDTKLITAVKNYYSALEQLDAISAKDVFEYLIPIFDKYIDITCLSWHQFYNNGFVTCIDDPCKTEFPESGSWIVVVGKLPDTFGNCEWFHANVENIQIQKDVDNLLNFLPDYIFETLFGIDWEIVVWREGIIKRTYSLY